MLFIHIYRSSPDTSGDSHWGGHGWGPQHLSTHLLSRGKPTSKIPVATKTVDPAGKIIQKIHVLENILYGAK